MTSRAEKELILDYSLQSESNLEVALKLHSAFDEIRKRIITDFIGTFENAMKEQLDNQWIVINQLKENPFDRYMGFFIAKKGWRDNYEIGISSESYGARRFIIGVKKSEKSQPIAGGKLKSLIDDKYKPGSASPFWEWYQWIEYIYGNWDNEEILIKMYKKDEAVNYFKEHILRIKEIAEPIIDEAVKSI